LSVLAEERELKPAVFKQKGVTARFANHRQFHRRGEQWTGAFFARCS
jgi:hypothetical protein